jgi:hypothetical protein
VPVRCDCPGFVAVRQQGEVDVFLSVDEPNGPDSREQGGSSGVRDKCAQARTDRPARPGPMLDAASRPRDQATGDRWSEPALRARPPSKRSLKAGEGVRPSPSRSHRGSQQPRGHTRRWPTGRDDRAHEGATRDRCVHGLGSQHRGARGPACGPMSTTLDAGLRPMITLPTSYAARLAPADWLDQSLATTARPASRDYARRAQSGRTPTLLPRTDRANEPTPPALARNAHPIPAGMAEGASRSGSRSFT